MNEPRAPIMRRLSELSGPDAAEATRPLLIRLVSSFVDRTPGELDRVGAAVRRGEAGTAAAGAHRLRGAAANLGAERLADRCADLDEAARAGELDRARAVLPGVRAAYAEVEPVLRDLLVGWETAAGRPGGAA